jgi:transcriptional regulator with XRE-family HTH domain
MMAPKERKGTLDALLRDRGLSIYALCKQSGIARQTVTKLCNGEGSIYRSTLAKLAEALKMDPSELAAILQGDGISVGV